MQCTKEIIGETKFKYKMSSCNYAKAFFIPHQKNFSLCKYLWYYYMSWKGCLLHDKEVFEYNGLSSNVEKRLSISKKIVGLT